MSVVNNCEGCIYLDGHVASVDHNCKVEVMYLSVRLSGLLTL